MRLGTTEAKELLEIYLDDHWAGAMAGKSLARRIYRNNEGTVWAQRLASLRDEIEEDDRTLAQIRRNLGLDDGGRLKRVLARIVERVSAVKPNGRAFGFSPLSRVLEAETMMSGVVGKRCLWISLGRLEADEFDLSAFDFESLEARAVDQLQLLREFHEHAVELVFS